MLVVLGAVLLFLWLNGGDAASELTLRLRGFDNTPRQITSSEGSGKITGELSLFDGVPSDLPGSWPRFRGANFDNISTEDIELARSWPADGPEVLWSIDLGEGYAGAAILAGRVYIIDYDQEKHADTIRCLSFEDGKEIWRYSYPIKVKRWHGMSRTVPVVTEKYVVTLGPKCHVTCLDSVTGEFKWMLNLVRQFNTTVPQWYAGQCPIIDDDKVIIAPGGDVLMMAVDCETGEIIWKTPNPQGWKMTHSSIMPMEFMGKRMYVYCGGDKGSGGVVGISPDDGSILWQSKEWKMRIVVPSPVVADNDLIFLSAGYNEGSLMLRLIQEAGKIKAQPVFRLEQKEFGAEQQTPIFYEGYIYGVRLDSQLVCLDTNGNIVWASTSANKFGKGPYIIADGLIFIMNDSGVLTVAKATPDGYSQLAQAKVLDGIESWGPMALASGRLIVRDLKRMVCLDIAQK